MCKPPLRRSLLLSSSWHPVATRLTTLTIIPIDRYRDIGLRVVGCLVAAHNHMFRRFQDIRTFTELSFADVIEPAPPAAAMTTYSDAIVNSYTTDYT